MTATCPYALLSWSRTYHAGDFFDASGHFEAWQAFAVLRWVGADGRYYCDLYLDVDNLNKKTGHGVFTRAEIERGFDLCGGPTCLAEMDRVRGAGS
jgi:hypothetical protein